MDERLLFRYATFDLYREHLELVHGVILAEDGRSVKPPSSIDPDPKPEPSCRNLADKIRRRQGGGHRARGMGLLECRPGAPGNCRN